MFCRSRIVREGWRIVFLIFHRTTDSAKIRIFPQFRDVFPRSGKPKKNAVTSSYSVLGDLKDGARRWI